MSRPCRPLKGDIDRSAGGWLVRKSTRRGLDRHYKRRHPEVARVYYIRHTHVHRREYIRQAPSGLAFRTRAGGALGTTGHTRSQHQNQVHQEGQQNENQV